MAEIQTITNTLGQQVKIINVSNSVGANAVNLGDDVLIVKALLHYSHLDFQTQGITGIGIHEIPSPHDITVYGMAGLIKRFQKAIPSIRSLGNYKIKADGRVSPVGQTAVRNGVYYTIAALNVMAKLAALKLGNKSDVETILDTYDIFIGKGGMGYDMF